MDLLEFFLHLASVRTRYGSCVRCAHQTHSLNISGLSTGLVMNTKVHICKKCESRIADGKHRCNSCGMWQWDTTPEEEDDGSVLLEDIISSNVDRMVTGPWDICFGRIENDDDTGAPGIVRGSTNIIGGSPGAGKSTLFLQLADGVIQNYSLPVLYLSAEEQLPQIKARAERMKILSNRLLRFIDLRKGTGNLSSVLNRYKFGLLILDSIKALAESDEGAIEICKVVKEFATMQHAPALLSQHITKDMALAGLMSLQHEVDSTMTFFPDTDRIGEDGEAVRVLETQKNRNGMAFVSAEFIMTKRGLVWLDPQAGDITDDENSEDEDDE